jgi:type II secretory pathway pseudopilin PulG
VRRARRRAGLTLVEICLALGLVLIIAGAVAVGLPALSEGRMLAQGAQDVETVIHMARADAANSGKRIRLEFQEDESGDTQPTLTIERDPIAQPGTFSPYGECPWVYFLDAARARVVFLACTIDVSDMVVSDPAGTPGGEDDAESRLHPLTFYADGSCDSAVLELANAANDEDARVARIEIDGLSGKIVREVLTPSQLEESEYQ